MLLYHPAEPAVDRRDTLLRVRDLPTQTQFHREVIDAVLTVAVSARQRPGIRVALQTDSTRELRVQLLSQRFFGRARAGKVCHCFKTNAMNFDSG